MRRGQEEEDVAEPQPEEEAPVQDHRRKEVHSLEVTTKGIFSVLDWEVEEALTREGKKD